MQFIGLAPFCCWGCTKLKHTCYLIHLLAPHKKAYLAYKILAVQAQDPVIPLLWASGKDGTLTEVHGGGN
jgi:hypothetical protein